MAIRQLKDGRWAVYYRVRENRPDKIAAGKKSRIIWEYFGRGAVAEAAAYRRNDELNLKPRRPAMVDLGPAFAELAAAYVQAKNFSKNSKKHLVIRLAANVLPFFGALPAIKINDADLDDYVAKRRSDPIYGYKKKILRYGVKDSTISRELTDLKAILNWSVSRQLININPVATYKKPKADDDIIPLPSTSEIEKIIKAASPHLIRAIFLSHYTGLRPGSVELLSLRWKHVDWDAGTILVVAAQKGGAPIRRVPIHDEFLDLFKLWYAADGKRGPIVHYRARPIKKIQTAWAGALKRAGIFRRLRPYDLRHAFVTYALESGADLKALAEIVGSRPETLMRHYQHVSSALHKKTVNILPRLNAPADIVKK